MSIGHLYVLSGEVFIQVLCPFLKQALKQACSFFGVELFQFVINFEYQPLLICIIGEYVLPFIGLSFHFIDVSFAVQKLFSLMKSHLFIFSFISLAQEDISKKILLQEMSDILLPMFSSGSFMVSNLTFESLLYIEFILVYSGRRWFSFIYLHVSVQFSQHHLLNRLSLLHCMFLPTLSNIN